MLKKLYEEIAAGIIDALNMELKVATITKIERLELKPGDVIVLKSKYQLSALAYECLTESIKGIFPDHEHKVIVLEEEMDIAVIGKTNGYCTCEKFCPGIYDNTCGVCDKPARPSQ